MPAQAQTGLTLSKVGNEIVEAFQAQKIATASDEQIKEVLRYAMILVGIRANNMPVEIEKQVLIGFVRKKYAGHTIQELRIAFEKAVAGELSLKPAEVNPYENFTCEYVGRIMRAYRDWASVQYEQYRLFEQQPEPVKQLPPPELSDADYIQPYYDDYLAGKLNVELVPEFIYHKAVKLFGALQEAQIKEIVLLTREKILERYRLEISTAMGPQRARAKESLAKLEAMDPLDSCNDPLVDRYAKMMALVKIFQRTKEATI